MFWWRMVIILLQILLVYSISSTDNHIGEECYFNLSYQTEYYNQIGLDH